MANWWPNTLVFLASLSLLIFVFVTANSDFCGAVFESQLSKYTKLSYSTYYVLSSNLSRRKDKIILFPFLNRPCSVGHAIKTTVVGDEFEFQPKCIANGSCKSFNVHPSSSKANRRICELNNKTQQMKPKDFKPKKGSTYYGSVKVRLNRNTYEWLERVITNQGP